jgi:hypothetical protein
MGAGFAIGIAGDIVDDADVLESIAMPSDMHAVAESIRVAAMTPRESAII